MHLNWEQFSCEDVVSVLHYDRQRSAVIVSSSVLQQQVYDGDVSVDTGLF